MRVGDEEIMETTYRIQPAAENRIDSITDFVLRMLAQLYPPGACNLQPDDLARFKEVYIERADSCFYIAEDSGGRIIGTAAVRGYDDRFSFLASRMTEGSVCEMSRFYIDPAFRKQGIGRQLYARTEAYAIGAGYQGSYLHTSVYLPGGYPYWLSNGYEPIHWETEQIVHLFKAL